LTHDLRNPLGAVKMAVELIAMIADEIPEGNPKTEIKNLVHRALKNTRRADHLIQDLLDATVLDAGEELHLNLTECDLLSIVQEVVSELSSADQPLFQMTGESAKGVWDPESLRRAFENLVSNALKYGTPGAP